MSLLVHDPVVVDKVRKSLELILGVRCVFPAADEDNSRFQAKHQWTARCMIERTDLNDASKTTAVSRDSIEDFIAKERFILSTGLTREQVRQVLNFVTTQFVENCPVDEYSTSVKVPKKMSWVPDVNICPHHPNISKIIRAAINDEEIVLVHSFAKHSLLSVARFHASTTLSSGTLSNTTGLGCKDLRLRFIIYQLLQGVYFLHKQGFCLDSLRPSSVMIDDDMWLYLPVGLSNRTLKAVKEKLNLVEEENTSSAEEEQKSTTGSSAEPTLSIPRHPGYYEPLTIQWVSGKLSNFEYLMAINYGAGRTMMDPLYHPILPWVTDFSTDCYSPGEETSYRDLTMTKFRLSKGDTQLETTYRHSEPPHHIPESLSELTYYIYMARRTPMQVLRRVVRDVFVPEHYPHSMHRIFEWTPDECIPEFYFDTSVFESIHQEHGLHDLEFPSFAPSAEEFIKYHRAVLESDYVSENLHLWVDLTFGYCLDGDAAIEHMNVPLRHTLTSSERMGLDSPNVNKNPGFVMLFDRPHPKKQCHNQKSTSHIYSYNNTRKTSPSFDALNPVYHFDSSNKYLPPSSAVYNMSNKSFGIDELIKIDGNLMSNSNRNALGANRDVSALTAAYSNAVEEMKSAAANPTSGKKMKKSLFRPGGESSLAKLKQADFIDLSDDSRCVSSMENLLSQTQHYKFAVRSGTSIDGCYSLEEVDKSLEGDIANARNVNRGDDDDEEGYADTIWDAEFADALKAAQDMVAALSANHGEACSEVQTLQAQDMFAIGCMIAELYLGRTLISRNDALAIKSNELQDSLRTIYRGTAGLPLVIRRIIALLSQPHLAARPEAGEILSACILSNVDNPIIQRDANPCDDFFTLQVPNDTGSGAGNNPGSDLIRFTRIEVLSDYCGALFPDYFRVVYNVVGAVKLAPDGITRLNVILSRVDEIETLPLEGINLALFHLLEVIGDSSPFVLEFPDKTRESLAINILKDYWKIIDIIGSRLGLEATEKLLVPQVVRFLNNFQNASLLKYVVDSPLWNVLLLRSSVRCFLRVFLPQLLTCVSAGTLHSMLWRTKSTPDAKENAPLWSVMESSDRSDWLRNASIESIHMIQFAAYVSIASLADIDSLGCGLTARYIVPSLLSLVGVPQLAISGFESRDDHGIPIDLINKVFEELQAQASGSRKPLSNDDRPAIEEIISVSFEDNGSSVSGKFTLDRDILEAFVNKKAVFNAQDMFVVKSLVQMGTKLGELVVAELVLSTIFNLILPDLENQIGPQPKEGVAAAFMEVILLLNGLLPMLSPETIHQNLLQPSRLSGSCLPKLLSSWPLVPAWSFLDDATEESMGQMDLIASIENVRLHSVLLELCRLIVSTSMIAGPEACAESVLPHVDHFYKNFVAVFGMTPVESRTMMKAFELGAELYLPLVQLMGVEAFYTAVPNLNPRLELWLGSVGSSIPPRSPPLPSNIWPEVTSEVSNQPEKKKSIMQWISGRSKWIGSLTSSNAPIPIVPNNAASNIPLSTTSSIATTPLPSAPNTNNKAYPTPVNGGNGNNSVSSSFKSEEMVIQSTTKLADDSKKAPQRKNSKHEGDLDGGDPHSTPMRPSITSKLLARTPMTHAKDPFSPTEGTELIEMENVDRTSSVNGSNMQSKFDAALEESLQLVDNHSVVEEDDTIIIAVDELVDDAKKKTTIEDHDIELDSIGESERGEESDEEITPPPPADEADSPYSPTTKSYPFVTEIRTPGVVVEEEEVLLTEVGKDLDTTMATSLSEDVASSLESTSLLMSTPVVEPASSIKAKDWSALSASRPTIRKGQEGKHNPYKIYQKLMAGKNVGKNYKGSSNHNRAKPVRRQTTKVGSILYNNDQETPEEIESRELRYSEASWLLAGHGRWNVDKEMKDRQNKEQNKLMKGGKPSAFHHGHNEWNPAAQMSMTSPKIAVDVANDTGSFINFQLHSNTQWKLEDAPGLIRCMVANPTESLLMTCSRTGVRLWSLSSHPLQHVSSYTNHSLPPFNGGFLRTGQHAMTCDGSIHVWDIESRHALSIIAPHDKNNGYSFASVIPSKFGVHPSIDAVGDEQILATMQDSVCYFDIRCYNHQKPLHRLAEWTLPQLPAPQSNFISSTIEPLQLSCAASHEHYVFAGSMTGGLWVLDRRMGKVLYSWQGHDGPILKIQTLSDRHFLAVSDRSAAVWEYISDPIHTPSSLLQTAPSSLNPTSGILSAAGSSAISSQRDFLDNSTAAMLNTSTKDPSSSLNAAQSSAQNGNPPIGANGFHTGLGGIGDVKRALSIKSGAEGIYSPSNLIVTSFDSASLQFGANVPGAISGPGGVSMGGGGIRYGGLDKDIGLSSKPQHVLYCLSGHKMYSGFLPSFDVSSRDRIHLSSNYSRETGEYDELKLTQSYFSDRKGTKLSRSKLQVTSSVLLPLRRLLLLGTEDGLVRVVS